MSIPSNVAESREVAGAHGVGELVGWARGLPNSRQRLGALIVCQLFFHLRQCRSDYVVVMNLRADGLDGVEPEAMDQFEIGRTESGRVRPKVIRVGSAA